MSGEFIFIKVVVVIVLIVLMVILTNRYGQVSIYGKITFQVCDNKIIRESFNKLSLTGIDLLKKLLLINKIKGYKIVVKDKSSGAAVQINKKIILSSKFENSLDIETLETVLHEYKHIQDRKIIITKSASFVIYSVFLLLSAIIFAVRIQLFNNSILWEINQYRLLIDLFMMGAVILATVSSIILEQRAIRYVPQHSKETLDHIGIEESISKEIQEYLEYKSKNIMVWYTSTEVFLGMLFFIFAVIVM